MSVEAKQAKQLVIDEIKERIEGAVSVVVVDYIGLTVEEADELRAQLRAENVGFTVYKNSLIKRAIAGTPYEALGEGDTLKGSTALAFCTEDATASARIIAKAMEKYKKMAFKGGIVEGTVYGKDEIIEFSKIPSREVLIARFMGSIQSPLTKLALLMASTVLSRLFSGVHWVTDIVAGVLWGEVMMTLYQLVSSLFYKD